MPKDTAVTPVQSDPWKVALQQFATAADLLSLKRGVREFVGHPKRELTGNFPVQLEDGSVRVFTGYRVQHSTVVGPRRGGRRDQPDGTRDELRGRRALMAWRLAALWRL